jgi:hypothetical protein
MNARTVLLGIFAASWLVPSTATTQDCRCHSAPVPVDLDLSKLKQAELIPVTAIGGGKDADGYVASYGSFRLGAGEFSGLIMARTVAAPQTPFFNPVALRYVAEYEDPGTKIAGSLYFTSFADGQGRYYLFGSQDVPSCAPVAQRYILAFDGKGKVQHLVLASYAKMMVPGKKD